VERRQGVRLLADAGYLHRAGLAFWRRTLVWGLVVINGAVLFKIGWTYAVSGTAGANAHLVPALAGLALVDGLLLVVGLALAPRRSQGSPA
jgi:hypothetical protein